jgi:CRISPR-associated protein Cmr2
MAGEITVVCISIGPVQDFISAARRTRDFAFGSFLLVHLAKQAAQMVSAYAQPLVFPATPEQDAPNKIVFVYAGQINQLPNHMAHLQQTLQGELRREIDRVCAAANLTGESLARAQAQVADVLEFYWAYATASSYKEAYLQADHTLSARKSLRDFTPFPMGSGLPKSSITGTYESVVPEELYTSANAKMLRRRFAARSAERLSGVDLLKRLGRLPGFNDEFPSVAEMAARGALLRHKLLHVEQSQLVYDPAFNEAWRAIDSEIEHYVSGNPSTPGRPYSQSPYRECIFEARLGDEPLTPRELENVTHSLRALHKEFKLKMDKPYYAFLLADGDRMGKVISQCLDVTPGDSRAHVDFSRALSGFASTVKSIVANHAGNTVYAGGDDVMAILPVHTAIDCAHAIQNCFATYINPFLRAIGMDQTASVSIGVVIAHHMDPMSDVVDTVHATEKLAKKQRSSLAVCVSKRSGGDVNITGQWYEQFPERVKQITELLRSGDLPDGYAYELRDLLHRLQDTHSPRASRDMVMEQIVSSEATRILKRKRQSDGNSVNDKIIEGLRAQITGGDEFTKLHEWVNEIIVARELL